MENEQRLAAFERMLTAVQNEYAAASGKIAQLRAAGKEKTATYRQLMANKLRLQELLAMYQTYGLLETKRQRGTQCAQIDGEKR